jgi:hypothetical protein
MRSIGYATVTVKRKEPAAGKEPLVLMTRIARMTTVIVRTLSLIALARNTETGDQLFGIFPLAFWALTVVFVVRRRDLLKLGLAMLAVKFVKSHRSPFYI